MIDIARKTEVVEGARPGDIDFDAILQGQAPKVFKGMVRDWPLVQEGLKSPAAAMDYLNRFQAGHPVVAYVGEPEIKGRFFYDKAGGMNFRSERVTLDAFMARIAASLDEPEAPSLYVGSTDVDTYLPGLRQENDLGLDPALFGEQGPLVGLWLGNRTTATAHYDMSNNIACCVVGRRRFTLFPPDQAANLYPGPLEPTPGGQVVSMVDFQHPDRDRHPNFEQAVAAARVAELEAGDVLVYPALWWHHVEALDPFNALINYWWNAAPAFMDTPMNTLLHGLLSLRDRPDHEKQAWRALFDYYLFGPADRAGAHLPEEMRGPLGPLDTLQARRLRALLLNRLNR